MEHEVDRLELGDGAVLVATDVHVAFGGVTAVDGVSLRLIEGSCRGLVGPNGAGKTTLLNAVSGIVGIDSGEIWLDEERIDRTRPQRRRQHGLARTFQNPALVGDLSAIDNVKVGLHQVQRWSAWRDLIGFGLARAGERRTAGAAAEALEAVGFPSERWHVPAAELSHGDQKIVDLARALAGGPRVILLDEPTAGLTVEEMDSFASVLKHQRETFRATMLIVSHHMRFLKDLCDTVTVMDFGTVLAEGSFDEVSQRPEVISAFLGEYDAAI